MMWQTSAYCCWQQLYNQVYVPTNGAQVLHSLFRASRFFVCFLRLAILMDALVSHCGFDLSLSISDIEQLFLCLLAIPLSLGKSLFKSFAHFKMVLCVFFG